ncbi:helix-turn-helix domain-containing protein [Vibrio alginolyticus]|uniref:helix-turn-helix domain-containing protein n=1 Tax=Vibrio alginolyticus TaxID=663 RepID=UPI001EEBE93B|nr:helix-turn-helix domain-containing protein [Vibrio alginolyticus]MCG6307885.1 helix-turn-helix domain-containing protein [Vibrio alginolyticus]
MTQFSATNKYLKAEAISLGLSGIEKATLVHLSTFADGKLQCFPSMKKLSQITGFSESAIKRAIKKLEGLDLITKKRRYSSSGPISNLYTLNTNALKDTPDKHSNSNDFEVSNGAFLAQDGNYYSCPAEFYIKTNSQIRGQLHA